MIEVLIAAAGMDCAGCETRLQTILTSVGGVQQVVADQTRNEVRVVFDPRRISETALRELVADAGFETSQDEQ